MKKTLLKIFLCVVALCATTKVMAWDNFGHSVIAYAAEQMLDAEVKAKCHHYLGSTITFQASWMDQYRSIEPYTECDKWHSTNIDAKYKVVVGREDTAAFQIERIRKEMGGGKYLSLPDSLVKVNLQYLIHMVGDTHCPVHVRWSKKDHPQFFYSLKNKGKGRGYHGFWDCSLGMWRKKWTAEKYLDNMDRLSKSEIKRAQKGTAYQWTQETADAARLCFALMPAGTDIAELSKEERDAVHSISDRQAQLAAYRLAGVLNEIFKKK